MWAWNRIRSVRRWPPPSSGCIGKIPTRNAVMHVPEYATTCSGRMRSTRCPIRSVPQYLGTPSTVPFEQGGKVCNTSTVSFCGSIIAPSVFGSQSSLKRCPKVCGTEGKPSDGSFFQFCWTPIFLSYCSSRSMPLSISSRLIPRYFRDSVVDS